MISPAAAASGPARRHDLDALRAAAMLLGIVFHASLSFALDDRWLVWDVSQSLLLHVFKSSAHGFRMQLFMLVSGFFTAMLWRQKGLKVLLWHRCRRVLFPCLLSLVTVVPAVNWAARRATLAGAPRRIQDSMAEPASASVWAAIRHGDALALERHLQTAAGKLDDQHLLFGTTPLTWATLMGRRDSVQALLARGADVNGRNRDGSTALHAAAFFGRAGIADLLIDKGADIHAASRSGEVPLGSAGQAWDAVQATASLLHIPVERQTVEQGREQMAARLRSSVAVFTGDTSPAKAGEDTAILPQFQAAYETLVNTPIFGRSAPTPISAAPLTQ